jgi:hypothetical protein
MKNPLSSTPSAQPATGVESGSPLPLARARSSNELKLRERRGPRPIEEKESDSLLLKVDHVGAGSTGAELADAFIALPGGIGAIEELMEVWAMNQLSEIDKPLGLLNTAGFYDTFLQFIDHMVETKFLPSAHRRSIAVSAHAVPLIETLRNFERVTVPTWI